MRSPSRIVVFTVALVLLSGCAGLPFNLGPQQATQPIPTLNPAELTVTPYPTSTPQPTYTPYPTAERQPTRTPFPTYAPRVTPAATADQTPVPAVPAQPAAGGAGAQTGGENLALPPATVPPAATFSGYLGIPQASDDVAELQPIVEVLTRGATCGDEILVQLGVVNWGSRPAYNFTVEWSAGIDIESGVTTFDILQWGDLPYYFRNKPIRYNCDGPTTFTAFVRVDTTNAEQEVYEDNNYAEITFTLPSAPPGEDG